MQRLAFVFLLFFFASCGSNEENTPATPTENWVLNQEHHYRYHLNPRGLPDTTYITTHNYKDGLVTDSSSAFYISKYSGNLLTDMIHYRIEKGKPPINTSSVRYVYDMTKNKMQSMTVYNSGRISRQETYSYNDSNQLVSNTTIQMMIKGAVPGGLDTLPINTSVMLDPSILGYDTVKAIYKYDDTKKIVGATFTNSQGKVLRTDVNIYSGDLPLWSYSVNPQGDTLQRIKYEPNGKTLYSRAENDSLVLWQNITNNTPIASKSFYKKTNELWRSASTFDQYGRKVTEKVYKNIVDKK
jgi:hypothetical protein